MQLYKIKLNEGHTAKRDQIYGGYLGYEGELALYTRGEALKKAFSFNGKIEKHGKNYTLAELRVVQLSRKEISNAVLLELDGREVMKDVHPKINEYMYMGDVFEIIIYDNGERPLHKRISFEAVEELRVLSQLTFDASYIILVD